MCTYGKKMLGYTSLAQEKNPLFPKIKIFDLFFA